MSNINDINRVKCSAILKSFGANKQVISRVQFTDYYLTKSLSTEHDNKFKKDLLAEWLISDYEIDNYMTKYHQGNPSLPPFSSTPCPSPSPYLRYHDGQIVFDFDDTDILLQLNITIFDYCNDKFNIKYVISIYSCY
jgi:hypothetical protein